MQSSLVHDAKKPCLQRRQIFTGFTYYRFINSQPRPLQTTASIQFAKIQLFTTRLQVFRPHFCNPPCLRCTSGVLPSRSTPDEQPHNFLIPNPKTAAQLPKGVLVYFLFKIIANASRMTSASVLRSLYDPIKAFLCILSSMDDNFASIISFINDKLDSFYPTRIYTGVSNYAN